MRRSKSAASTSFGALHFASRLTPHASPPLIRDRIGDWIFPPKGPEIGPVVLGQRRVYILPTASDDDSPAYGIQRYELDSTSNKFGLLSKTSSKVH